MPTTVNPLRVRQVMGRKVWTPPTSYGPTGWRLYAHTRTPDGPASLTPLGTIVITVSELPDAQDVGDFTYWTHASMSWIDRVPTYDELVQLKRAVWGDDGEAYQVHSRAERHVNLHEFALHLWGRADGSPVLPDFGRFGTI